MLPAIKNIIFLDFETYYAQTYTLKTLTPPEYILHPWFEEIGCAVAVNNQPSVWIDGPDFPAWLAQFDPAVTATVTFNSLFDNSILSWRHNFLPAMMYDSMNIARALRGHVLYRNNLETVCKVLKTIHQKGNAVHKVMGMRRADIMARPELWREFKDYANTDNEASREIFTMLIKEFPHTEARIMDMVIRCAVRPRFILDKPVLINHLDHIRNEKINLLRSCGANLKPGDDQLVIKQEIKRIGLMSTKGFQAALEKLNITIETKTNKNGEQIPAFAKSDSFMQALQEHPDTRVQALACARLGVKSTQEETRTQKFLNISELDWSGYRGGNVAGPGYSFMPVPLRYAGAHTHRLSGEWKLNLQNLPAGRAGKTTLMRQSLIAPPGYQVVAGDLAQIEARLVAWLAGCKVLLDEFIAGDPYSAFASTIFGFQVHPKQNPYHRFIGKTGILGLGFQCGSEKFYNMVLTLARLMGIDLAKYGINWDRQLAQRTVLGYRSNYVQIPTLWAALQSAIEGVWSNRTPGTQNMRIKCVTISFQNIEGPSGLSLKYDSTGQIEAGSNWVYQYGRSKYNMYGGKMLENIIQFLARIIIMNAALRLAGLGYWYVLQAHDELAYIVPDHDVTNAKFIIEREMSRRPSWAPDLPLKAEVKSGPNYGATK